MNIVVTISALLLPVCLSAASLDGTVVEDHSGKVLRNVTVRVTSSDGQVFFAEVRTDAVGHFLVSGLSVRQYRVEVLKPNYLGIEDLLQARDAGAANTRTATITFRLIRHAVIAGRMLDAQSDPIAGARALLFRRSRMGIPWEPVGPRSLVDPGGGSRFHGIPPGEYRVVGLAGSSRIRFPDNERPGQIAVFGGEEFESTVVQSSLDLGVSVSGRLEVTGGGIGVVSLVDSNEPQVIVSAQPIKPNGEFRFSNVPRGTYEILGTHIAQDSIRRFGMAALTVGESSIEGLDVSVSAGKPLAISTRSYEAGAAGTCRPPVTIAAALIEGNDTGRAAATAVVDEGRPGTIGPLQPGLYRLLGTTASGLCRNRSPLLLDLRRGMTVQHVTLTMARSGSVVGQLDVASELLSQYLVILVPFGSTDGTAAVRVREPAADGRFSFESLPSGSYYLMVRPSITQDRPWRPRQGLDPDLINVIPGDRHEVRLVPWWTRALQN